MPNLAQMFATCNAKSQYSRTEGEIYDALSEAGFFVYAAILKELSNFFLKFDTTTVVLTPDTQKYILPPDCTQLVSISERKSASGRWKEMASESIPDAINDAKEDTSFSSYGGRYGESEFRFAGPFLEATETTTAPTGFGQAGYNVGGYRGTGFQTQSILISPIPQETRFVELAYIAKWIPLVDRHSYLMLPDECTPAMQAFAIAELLRSNNDSNALAYDAKGQTHLNMALTWVRARQIQNNPTITPYVDGDDDGGYDGYY
jgi:hypothetical protein